MNSKFFIISFIFSFVTIESYSQNLEYYQFYPESQFPELSPTNFSSDINDSTSFPWPHILAIESIFLGYSYLSTYTWGAYFTGGSFGVAAAGLTGVLIYSDNSDPEITLPFAVGFGFLTYYNFRFAETHSPTRKFWTNMIGFHATMLTPIVIGKVFQSNKPESSNLVIQSGINTIKLTYKF